LSAESGSLATSAIVSQGGAILVFAGGTSLGATLFFSGQQGVDGVAVPAAARWWRAS